MIVARRRPLPGRAACARPRLPATAGERPRRRPFVAAAVAAMALVGVAAAGPPAALELPAIFSDHMVLQRQRPVPVWGRTQPGRTVTVSFQGQTKTATAGPDGAWMVTLDPMEAQARPQELSVTDATAKRTFADVLVGEVWFGCGQSNMEFGWTFSDEFKKRRAAQEKTPEKADDPNYMGAASMRRRCRCSGGPSATR